MGVKLLADPHLKFLGLKGGCIGSFEYTTLVKMPHYWKSQVAVQMYYNHGAWYLSHANIR